MVTWREGTQKIGERMIQWLNIAVGKGTGANIYTKKKMTKFKLLVILSRRWMGGSNNVMIISTCWLRIYKWRVAKPRMLVRAVGV